MVKLLSLTFFYESENIYKFIFVFGNNNVILLVGFSFINWQGFVLFGCHHIILNSLENFPVAMVGFFLFFNPLKFQEVSRFTL